MKIEFLRVTGIRTPEPVVLARADGLLVAWRHLAWSCECGRPGCRHVDAVRDLLDPRVLVAPGGAR